jgi:hypothetical protein
MAQRRGFRECLAGLLVPRERNKTLTALAGAEPVTGPKLPAVQRLLTRRSQAPKFRRPFHGTGALIPWDS